MKKLTCEIGDTFGNWTIIKKDLPTHKGHVRVLVQCKCGKIAEKNLSELKRGRIKGCKNCSARARGKEIIIGDKYKNWTIISGPHLETDHIIYEARCSCGKTRFIQAKELLDPNHRFQCQKCAQKLRGIKAQFANGRIGELCMTKYSKMKRTAAQRKIEFVVSLEELWDLYLQQNRRCAITGDIINNINNASLDRINSSKGYFIENVQWVTKQANLSKHVMSMDELYTFCKKVLNHANQQPSSSLTTCEGSETND